MAPALTHLRSAVRFAQTEEAEDLAPRIPGVVLTLYRIASDVAAIDVAAALAVSKQYVGKLEREGATAETAARFKAAVDGVREAAGDGR